MNNEVYAAISMALYEAMGYTSHVEESGKVTIERQMSPWMISKITSLAK